MRKFMLMAAAFAVGYGMAYSRPKPANDDVKWSNPIQVINLDNDEKPITVTPYYVSVRGKCILDSPIPEGEKYRIYDHATRTNIFATKN